jgi:hypothetical protein
MLPWLLPEQPITKLPNSSTMCLVHNFAKRTKFNPFFQFPATMNNITPPDYNLILPLVNYISTTQAHTCSTKIFSIVGCAFSNRIEKSKIAQKPFKSFLGFHRQRMRKTTETLFIQTHLALALPSCQWRFRFKFKSQSSREKRPNHYSYYPPDNETAELDPQKVVRIKTNQTKTK